MSDIEISIRMVREAEAYLAAARNYLEKLQSDVRECSDPVKKKELENSLEQDRIRFAQMYKDVVIYKAVHGVFTDPVDPTQAHKRLD